MVQERCLNITLASSHEFIIAYGLHSIYINVVSKCLFGELSDKQSRCKWKLPGNHSVSNVIKY